MDLDPAAPTKLAAEYARCDAERRNLANLITHYWIPRTEHLETAVIRWMGEHGEERERRLLAEDRVRQAIYETFMDHFGCDEQDPDEIHAADAFCRETLAHYSVLIDGEAT